MIEVTEFFCGIGGFACALPSDCAVLAIDINAAALEVYRANHGHEVHCQAIESLTVDWLGKAGAGNDLWWMSPPCQPHTMQGHRRDMADTRSQAFCRMLELIEARRPLSIGLENVPGFTNSASRIELINVLGRLGYDILEQEFCPTDWGAINRRRRYYLVASQQGLDRSPPCPGNIHSSQRGWLETLTALQRRELEVPQHWQRDYAETLPVISEQAFLEGTCETRCFTSAYGKSPLRGGSMVRDACGIRFFTPREILVQLGFPLEFRLPEHPPGRLWPLVGNTLAITPLHVLLHHLGLNRTIAEPMWDRGAPPVDSDPAG